MLYHEISSTSLDFDLQESSSPATPQGNYKPSKVILVKGIPQGASEIDILTLFLSFGTIKDILVNRQNHYAFLEFEVNIWPLHSQV